MYCDEMISVGKIENGFLINVRAHWKKKSDEDEKCCCSIGIGYGEKSIYAKDAAELGKKIEAVIPMLNEEFDSEEAFDMAFRMASKTHKEQM